MHLEVNITYGCNITCKWCNRLVGQIDFGDTPHVTPEQMRRFVDHLKDRRPRLRFLKIVGGEPLYHPQFLELMGILKELLDAKVCRSIAVVTNAILDRPELPEGFEYWLSPVKEKQHTPIMVSPDDIGYTDDHRCNKCMTLLQCGQMFDAWGFTFCPVAGALGRVLGKDVYVDDIKDCRTPDPEVCKHCTMFLRAKYKRQLAKDVRAGRHEYPSGTFREGLERWKSEPVQLTKW